MLAAQTLRTSTPFNSSKDPGRKFIPLSSYNNKAPSENTRYNRESVNTPLDAMAQISYSKL